MINNLRLWRSIEHAIMKRHVLLDAVLALGLLAVVARPLARLHRRKASRTFSAGCVSGGWANG